MAVTVTPPPLFALRQAKDGNLPSIIILGLWSQETACALLYELSRLPLSELVDALEEFAAKGIMTDEIRDVIPMAKRYATIQSVICAQHEQEPLWDETK